MIPIGLVLCILSASQDKSAAEQRIDGARRVVAAIVRAAKENQRNATPRTEDELTAVYIKAAAREARLLPGKESVKSFLLGIGVGLDTARLLRSVPLFQSTWNQIENEKERIVRLSILGKPTMRGRHDLLQHFAVSAALTVVLGETLAESAGVTKELLDAQEGGSGFSFHDLTADLSGIRFAGEILKSPKRMGEIEKQFRVASYLPELKGLEEGLTRKQFDAKYGGIRDVRYRNMRDKILTRIKELSGYKGINLPSR